LPSEVPGLRSIDITKYALIFVIVHEQLQLEYIVVWGSSGHERDGIAFDKAPKHMIDHQGIVGILMKVLRDTSTSSPSSNNLCSVTPT
jgi:hypothetical protein